jgi:uncharacterized membrane protein
MPMPAQRGTAMNQGLNTGAAYEESSSRDMARMIYILYLCGLAAGITAVIGVVMAQIYQHNAPEWLRSHYRFQVRTFWIAALYLALILAVALTLNVLPILLLWLIWSVMRVVCALAYLERGESHPHAHSWLW